MLLDLCVSHHICNNQSLVTNIRTKSIKFVTAVGQVIWTKAIDTVSILLTDDSRIELQNVTLALECNSNLIYLGQIRETKITYHDNPIAMMLMRDEKAIVYAKRNRNLFALELAQPGRTMLTM